MISIWRRSRVALHVANASSINYKPLTSQSVSCSKLGKSISSSAKKKGILVFRGTIERCRWAVDQAILAEEERLVVIRFGHDWDETCMQMDEVLASVAETIKNFAVIYLVDITEVPDFNTINKHIMIDLGTGNNNKINWALKDKQEFIDIIETVYRGARKGRGLYGTFAWGDFPYDKGTCILI
ncbi:hypothetical protein CXB51_004407 [Gossypium anomalum]|uniref:Thioredoxin-like protein 4A n=1 Tax=Gossypium anomalum TaxID=47600 RepID=A0A8J6D9V9_9ROSI|nr:hypothetical protein CXB51_004407 [Gossypium anomalum]